MIKFLKIKELTITNKIKMEIITFNGIIVNLESLNIFLGKVGKYPEFI